MARRRRLNAPSAEDLAKIADGFAAEQTTGKRPAGLGPTAPIARVASDAAGVSTEERIKAAKYDAAKEHGLLALNIPLDSITVDHLSRDRMRADDDEMNELRHSILAHGLRMPIEVLELSDADGPKYGLISGWRRLAALRALDLETGKPEFAQVAALVRKPKDASDAYISMVEENEIRADLSQFERGRIAVISAGQGAFASVEEAVDALFAAGSKAKRSKIRSFALIFEELGDLLAFPTHMSERAGLRLAAALKAGKGHNFRNVLANNIAESFEAEWKLLDGLLVDHESGFKVKITERRIPKSIEHGVIELASGITIEKINSDGYIDIRFRGKKVDNGLVDSLMLEIQGLLEKV
ncbi:hypothetical protein A9Q96_09695 [Rhodobacterales bacterium 52_120_T64]|nr:hypothetical protein A9Q96_09695 [Rhodobacterales bacterium 52_120_T64]